MNAPISRANPPTNPTTPPSACATPTGVVPRRARASIGGHLWAFAGIDGVHLRTIPDRAGWQPGATSGAGRGAPRRPLAATTRAPHDGRCGRFLTPTSASPGTGLAPASAPPGHGRGDREA